MKAKWGTISVRKLKEQIIYIEKKKILFSLLTDKQTKIQKA